MTFLPSDRHGPDWQNYCRQRRRLEEHDIFAGVLKARAGSPPAEKRQKLQVEITFNIYKLWYLIKHSVL